MRVLSLIVALSLTATCIAAPERLIVHEWGTFTSLQDENGRAIGGLNSSEERLPQFVHSLNDTLIGKQALWSKSIPRLHPDVTMRMETPVIYFHPADAKPVTLDVKVGFRGGLLSEYYPNAVVTPTGAATTRPSFRINDKTAGTLVWKDVRIGGNVQLPKTDSHVWLAPRAVKSAPVTIGKESEQYIFYRGVGNLESPLRVTRHGDSIKIYDNRPADEQTTPMKPAAMWLAEFRQDGTACAFRVIDAAPAAMEGNPVAQPGNFAPGDFTSDNVEKLRASMHAALVADGLFADEADAMLETWKQSYFKTSGQRLFFLVPREWTDRVIPLEFSRPCKVERVMMGRVELITPQMRQAIDQLAAHSQPMDPLATTALYQTLGRFTDAILLDELRQQTTPGLAGFVASRGISTFRLQTAPPRSPATRPTVVSAATSR